MCNLPHQLLGQGGATFWVRHDPHVVWPGPEVPDARGHGLEGGRHVHVQGRGLDHVHAVGGGVRPDLFPLYNAAVCLHGSSKLPAGH